MSFRVPSLVAVLFAVALAPAFAQNAPPADPASAQQPISQAETLLFMTNHLHDTKLPARLEYTFHKSGSLEDAFDDSVNVDVKGKADDRTATTKFLTGPRAVGYPPVEHAEGNPVIMWFLERDIREMERLTGGKSPYFQKRIRLALADRAEVRPVKFSLGGKEVSGTEVKVSPYLEDPNKAKFGKVSTAKYYLFTLSDQVPGGVYQIRAVVPDDAGGKPLIDETLTFEKVAPFKG
ncbi:MAG TPA: hypothetical protein PLZ79_03160 [Burkholderiales bacterium]|nr:hypothetical protein [Burkholderiales bacterium]